MQPRGSAAEHCRGRRGVPSLSGAAGKRDGAVGAANARRGSRSARFRCAPSGGCLGGSSAPPSLFRRGLDVLQGKTASQGALGRRASTMGVLLLTPLGTGKANSRPILLSRLRCLSLPASRRCSAVVAEWRARAWLSQVPALPRGRGPAGAGLLEWPPAASLRRWPRGRAVGAFICPSPTYSLLLAAGRLRDGGVAGAPKPSGEAAAGRCAAPSGSGYLSRTRSQPRAASAVTTLRETRRSCRTASRWTAGPRLLKRRAGRRAGNGAGAYGEPCGLGRGAPGRWILPGAGVEESWTRSGTVARAGSTAGRRGGLGEGQAGLGAAGVWPRNPAGKG